MNSNHAYANQAKSTPSPLAHLIANPHRYCPHGGGHAVEQAHFVTIMHHDSSVGNNETLYEGCHDCLRRLQHATTTGLSDGTKALLQRCREHIMDSDWKRVDALVADIDAMLKGQ